jgi:nucleoside triphosphate pyrophosphatase
MTITCTTTHRPLLLASASPRRRQIISRLGLPFTVAVPPGDEDKAQTHYQGPIDGLARWTAMHKALMALTLPQAANSLIITADTTVLLDGQILGKPRDAANARELLLALRGRWHCVTTGVVVSMLVDGEVTLRGKICTTPVLMRAYSEDEIDAYIATGDPMDKAGAYGIQNAQFQPTEQIDGCYLNVVGLPLCILVDLLAEFGVQSAIDIAKPSICICNEQKP